MCLSFHILIHVICTYRNASICIYILYFEHMKLLYLDMGFLIQFNVFRISLIFLERGGQRVNFYHFSSWQMEEGKLHVNIGAEMFVQQFSLILEEWSFFVDFLVLLCLNHLWPKRLCYFPKGIASGC